MGDMICGVMELILERDYSLNDVRHYFENFFRVYIYPLDHHHHRLRINNFKQDEYHHLVNINPLEHWLIQKQIFHR